MSDTTRKGLVTIANLLGKTKNKIFNSIGDNVKTRGSRLEAETAFTRLKTSINFHDYDLAKKSTDGYTEPRFLTFDEADPIGFGIQGGEIYPKRTLSVPLPIYTSGVWNPSYDGPPSYEGWGIWLYNGWGSYIPPTLYTNPRTNNTTVYAPYGGEYLEPSSATITDFNAARAQLSAPSKYVGNYAAPLNLADYETVPKFENARWISIRNTYGDDIDRDGKQLDPLNVDTVTKNIKIKLHKDVLTGFKLINGTNDAPQDIKLLFHDNLIQNYTSSWQSVTLPNDYDQLYSLDFKIYPYNEFFDDTLNYDITKDTEDYWIIEINLPVRSTWNWTDNYWWHIAIYWNSTDSLTLNSHTPYAYDLISYDMTDIAISSSDGSIDVPNSNLIIWNKKSFFKQSITNYVDYTLTGYNDTNLYLTSYNKTLFQFKDGEYTVPQAPFRYKMSTVVPKSDHGSDGSLVGYHKIAVNQLLPILICTENLGSQYDSPVANYKIVSGVPFDRENIDSYELFDNYPFAPDTYDVLFKCLLSRPVEEVFELVQDANFIPLSKRILEADGINFNFLNVLNDSSIVYLEKLSINYSKYGNQDQNVSELITPAFFELLSFARNTRYQDAIDAAAIATIPESARLSVTRLDELLQIKTSDPFNYRSLLHFLLKRPTDTLLKNTSYDPKAIQFDYEGNSLISSFAADCPSTDLAILSSDHLTNYDISLPVESNMEVYQELSLLCEAIDPNVSGDKIGLDYAFRLSLEDSNQNTLQKDLYINASKYFLTDNEYYKRTLKGLSVQGYYKYGTAAEQSARADGTLESIEDYRLYGYAGCIPDLTMEQSRPILTRVVGSDKQDGQTKEQFIASLSPGTDINEALANYEGDFVEINLNHYPETWVKIKDIGMSTSKFSLDTNPYWLINYYALIGGDGKSQNIQQADDYYPYTSNDVRADSFTIATKGLGIADSSVQVIENIYNQQASLDSTYGMSQTVSSSGIAITQPVFAIRVTPLLDSSSQSFKLRLSNTIPFISTGKLNVDLYSSSATGNTPQSIIKTGTSINLTDVKPDISEYSFGLGANLSAETDYWLVFKSNQEFRPYSTNLPGTVACSGTSVTGTGTTFTNYFKNSQIGFGSTVPENISTWYTISSITNDTALTLTSSAGTISSGSDYVIKHNFKVWGSSTGSNKLAIQNKDSNWFYYTGRAYIVFFQPSANIYGTFNRTDYTTNLLPPPNKQRENAPIYNLESYVSFTSKKISPPEKLQLYPRAFYGGLAKETIGTVSVSTTSVTGTNNSSFLLYTGQDIQIGFGSRNHLDVTTWYDVTTINSANSLTLSTSASTATNVEYAIRFRPEWNWAKFSKDCYVYIKYYANNTLKENFITLEKAPSWQTWWYLANATTIDNIGQNIELEKTADSNIITSELNFSNYSVSGTTEYIQAKVKGKFYPNTTGSHDFRFYSSYGIKIFVNGSTTPIIDNMTNTNSSYAHTFSLSLVSDELVTFDIIHTHKANTLNSISHPQVLLGEWKLTSDVSYSAIDSSFYSDAIPAPVDIDPDGEPIDRIVYLTVGKTLDEISTPTHGAPPSDRIVFRST